jgi:hypothetical protein
LGSVTSESAASRVACNRQTAIQFTTALTIYLLIVSIQPLGHLAYLTAGNSFSHAWRADGSWLLAAGLSLCWLAAGCLDAGCWLLAAGCWLLAAGCWLLGDWGLTRETSGRRAWEILGITWNRMKVLMLPRGTPRALLPLSFLTKSTLGQRIWFACLHQRLTAVGHSRPPSLTTTPPLLLGC